MRLSAPKKSTWYLCLVLWVIGILLVVVDFAEIVVIDNLMLYAALILALAGVLSLLAAYLKGF